VLAAIVPAALIEGLILGTLAPLPTVICAGYWGLTYSAALATFVMRGWFGNPPIKLPPAMERRRRSLTTAPAGR
jgi:hypothetical protein